MQRWMSTRNWKLSRDKTNIKVVHNPLQIRNIDVPSNLKLEDSDTDLASKIRNVAVILDESLTLKHQIAAVRKESYWGSYEYS